MRRLLISLWILGLALAINYSAPAQAKTPVPEWVKNVGASRAPNKTKIFSANTYGAAGDGLRNSTKPIQQAIDSCAKAGGGIVTLSPGQYVTGALFLKSNVEMRIPNGATLLGSQDDADYPSFSTRIAGIEME